MDLPGLLGALATVPAMLLPERPVEGIYAQEASSWPASLPQSPEPLPSGAVSKGIPQGPL